MIAEGRGAVWNIFRQHAASIYGFVHSCVSFVCRKKKLCVRSLGYIVGASPPPCVRSIGNTGGAYPPHVGPFIGRQSSLDPCMLPTLLCCILYFTFKGGWKLDPKKKRPPKMKMASKRKMTPKTKMTPKMKKAQKWRLTLTAAAYATFPFDYH